MDTAQLIKAWLQSSSLQPTTRKQYEAQLSLFFSDYNIINKANVLDFLWKGQGEARVYHRKYAVKNFLQYLRTTNNISLKEYREILASMKEVKYKVKDRKEVDTILIDELEHLIANITDTRLRLILMIGFDTAARVRSILKLRHQDIRQFQNKPALFMREKREKTNLKIITPQTHQHLVNYAQAVKGEYLFFDADAITSQKIDDEYYELWYLLRKQSKKILGKYITFHWIRRGAAIYWYRKTGKDIVFVQQLLGHESPATTAKYLKLEGEAVRQKMKTETRNW